MGMKETPRSLSIYFAIVGLIGTLGNFTALWQVRAHLVPILFLIPGIFFSCAYLYFGFSLKRNLTNTPLRITRVLIANMLYLGVLGLLSVLRGLGEQAGMPIFGFLITWYLLRNVRRLSSEYVTEKGMA